MSGSFEKEYRFFTLALQERCLAIRPMLHLRLDGTLLIRFDGPEDVERLFAALHLGTVDPLWRSVSRRWNWHAVFMDLARPDGMHPRPVVRIGVQLTAHDLRLLADRLRAHGEPFAADESRLTKDAK